MADSELSKRSNGLELKPEQRFEQLNLKELGLQPQDFAEVMDAHQELAEISTTAVAEYGKNIANKTSTYTDELLNLVQNKDLDATGQKLNEVVQVAQQLNTSSILNKSKNSGFLGGLLSKFKGAKQSFDQHFNTTKEHIDVLVKAFDCFSNGLAQVEAALATWHWVLNHIDSKWNDWTRPFKFVGRGLATHQGQGYG